TNNSAHTFNPYPLLLLGGTLPTFQGDLFATGHGEGIFLRRLGDGGTRANRCTGTDFHWRYQRTVGTDEGTITDHGLVLVHAIVIAGNGTGTDIHLFTYLGIAQIGQMIGLGILAHHDVLGFNKIANLGMFLEYR